MSSIGTVQAWFSCLPTSITKRFKIFSIRVFKFSYVFPMSFQKPISKYAYCVNIFTLNLLRKWFRSTENNFYCNRYLSSRDFFLEKKLRLYFEIGSKDIISWERPRFWVPTASPNSSNSWRCHIVITISIEIVCMYKKTRSISHREQHDQCYQRNYWCSNLISHVIRINAILPNDLHDSRNICFSSSI